MTPSHIHAVAPRPASCELISTGESGVTRSMWGPMGEGDRKKDRLGGGPEGRAGYSVVGGGGGRRGSGEETGGYIWEGYVENIQD